MPGPVPGIVVSGTRAAVRISLAAPDELVPREEKVKVTLLLSRRIVDFFKRAAKVWPACLISA